jgi:ASC-1-like (ASCH) protein
MHLMHLQAEEYNSIKNGTKRVEFRLFDAKRRMISIGDELQFENVEDGERITVKVVDMIVDTSGFTDLVKKFTPEMMASESEEKALEVLNKFYTPEQQIDNAVVAIVFKLLK